MRITRLPTNRRFDTPGVVVMHEANLHHLIADITIKRNDWDAYLREVEFDGGAELSRMRERVRALEVGPDYEGVPMLRRLLERSRGAIVHSHRGDGCARAGFRRTHRRDSARRMDSRRGPAGLSRPARVWTNDSAHRHLRISEAV